MGKRAPQRSKSSIQILKWLPDMGSNHDWVSQSHQCYHYTIGQEEGIVG